MSEQELRTALAEYAGPAVPPPGGRDRILSRVAAHKRRFRVSAGIAAAAAVATVIAGGLMLRPDGGSTQPQPIDGWQPERTSNAPYEVPGCSSEGEIRNRLPDLAQVTAVRMCSDSRSFLAGEPVALDEGGATHDPEGLVELEPFRRLLGALSAADPARCAAISVPPTADTLMLVLADGSRLRVPATLCADVHRGSTPLDGAELRGAFLEALDEQRQRVGYDQAVDEPVPCRFAGQAGPVRPQREHFVAAAACPGYNDPGGQEHQLDAAQLDRLNAAWREAEAGTYELDNAGDARCYNGDDEDSFLVVRSNRGDLVTLRPSECDTLEYLPFTASPEGRLAHLSLPITLDALQ